MECPPREYSRTELVPVRVEWHCPSCEDGKMVATGQNVTRFGGGLPPLTEHFHQCDVCGHTGVDRHPHPRIEYDEAPLPPIDF